MKKKYAMSNWEKEFEEVAFSYRDLIPKTELKAMNTVFKRVLKEQRAKAIDELVYRLEDLKYYENVDIDLSDLKRIAEEIKSH